ncbi:hypothetical protein BJV74DRAFT_764888 [Russula compacta]|nr:hypothetical protein BJV74DRAFT_764888 [Russula compacta]
MSHWRALTTRSKQLSTRRWQHADSGYHRRRPSRHAQFYSDLVPAMIPVALLGSAVYMGLQLLQTYLSHEKYLDETQARVEQLEREIDALILERGSTSPLHAVAAKEPADVEGWFRWHGRR